MAKSAVTSAPSQRESRLALAIFVVCLGFNFWGVQVGWTSRNLPGGEFRQAQTALSTYWIKAEDNFSLAYPTPVLGKPWSVPMEFPLYQWTVVVTGKVTGWALTKAGRAVSIACFYLALPAVFLLLARWNVAPGRRWLVLAVVVTCPLYVFYTRGFLIETMALMFSLWFWVAFERTVEGRSKGWLALAIVAGTGAGLVKVTTFLLYLIPAAGWALARLWRRRREGWLADCGWMAAAVAVPFAATLWWLHFADATKELNVLGSELTSANLRDFNLGTTESRLSLEQWTRRAQIVREELTSLPVLLLCAVLVPLAGRGRWREIAVCLGFFVSALLVFPVLYLLHDYYYVANTVLLLMAMGLVLVALAESGVSRWVVGTVVCVVLGGQAWRYGEHYYPVQDSTSAGGDELTRSLQMVTQPDDVIVVLGQDWNSMTPYYARRRAAMIRDSAGRDSGKVERVLAALDGEKIGALVITGEPDGSQWLIDRAAARGLAREPLYVWRDAKVYVPQARQNELLHALIEGAYSEVRLAPGVVVPVEDMQAHWVEMASLRPWQRRPFVAMKPAPVRFFATFGPAIDASSGQTLYGAHPVTRLIFALPAGRHTLRSHLQMALDAYKVDLTEAEATDGVEVSLFALGSDGERHLLHTRHFDPRHNPADRGQGIPLVIEFTLQHPGEVELFFGPGPSGRDTRDWIVLAPLTID